MSLHALAGHMATKGRGGDSMLVHMTPKEVQSLQVLALKNGGSLTINPDTGLPEANFLKSILPIVAGFALGPAGFGLMSAGMAGAAVGGITALSTGSLSRGLMAGLGAYGGANLGGSLMNAGTGAMAASDIAAQQAAGTFPALAEGAGAEQIAKYAADVGGVRDAALAKAGEAGFGSKMSAGFGQMASNPGAYTSEMLTGLAAISPMLADKGVQTTTPRQDTGTIRNYTFDPYGQTYTSAGNYPASEYKGMAQGGIVALAEGGAMPLGGLRPDSDIQNWFATNQGADDKTIAAAMKQYGIGTGQLANAMGFDPDEVTRRFNIATGQPVGTNRSGVTLTGDALEAQPQVQTQVQPQVQPPEGGYTTYTPEEIGGYLKANPKADLAAATKQFNADPRAVNQYITSLTQGYLDPTQTTGGTGTLKYYDALRAQGIDANELFDAFKSQDPNYTFDRQGVPALQRAFDVATNFKGFDPKGATQLDKDIAWVKKMDELKLNYTDIARLTGLPISEVSARAKAAYNAMRKTAPPPITGTPNLPGGVSGGGNTVVNPNGTVTTAPAIPGRPEGGFTGTGQVNTGYEQAGGSLGYTNRVPQNMEEFNQRFNTQTGSSKAAYDYLVGKGAYPTRSSTPEIMRPYGEATLGIPAAEGRPTQKYLFQGGKYVENPNYKPLSYDSKGNRIVGLTPTEVLKGVQGLKDPKDDVALFDWVTANNVTEAQLAAALGISIDEARARIAAGKKAKVPDEIAGGARGYTGEAGGTGPSDGPSTGETGVSATGEATAGGPASGGGADNASGGLVPRRMALGGLGALAGGGATSQYNLGGYSDGGRLLRGPGDGVSDSIPATIGNKQPARLADGEFVVPARIVSELGNGSTEAGARKLYAMMDRVQKARGKTTGKNRVAANTRSEQHLPA